ncbi:hypothetical protein C5B94_03055 [Clavibacter michiganensis]|uniref:Uncharacterized protein n=2 Tax=Clavibacter michiganensis TaxID=28447 RepID=A0A2S5VY40_9MICO|nr:hypothetical protein C5B94_03055 [Clavibacter michiganensis]PPF70969.1 hypothetical protein C5E16_01595 [Clavibacter michiganensis]
MRTLDMNHHLGVTTALACGLLTAAVVLSPSSADQDDRGQDAIDRILDAMDVPGDSDVLLINGNALPLI